MHGLLDFLTLCNMGILFNVLDRRTYGTQDQSYIDTLRMDRYDYNTIPEDDRRSFVYARGISLELIEWLNSRWIVTGGEGNPERHEIEDFHVQHITRQGLTILQYLENWTEEENEKDDSHFPIIDRDELKTQLEWAMHTIPWISTSWSDTLDENAESFYLDSLYPTSGQPLQRDEMLPYLRWSEMFPFLFSFKLLIFKHYDTGRTKIYQMGLTKGDKLFFEGADSFYEITGKSKVIHVKDSPAALKRQLDMPTLSTTKTKRPRTSEEK
jgi:hypothetical protein